MDGGSQNEREVGRGVKERKLMQARTKKRKKSNSGQTVRDEGGDGLKEWWGGGGATGDHGLWKLGRGQEVSAPSRGRKAGVRRQRSPEALGSCWTEECTIISLRHSRS
eukprot:superscaffoldBa00005918_g20933